MAGLVPAIHAEPLARALENQGQRVRVDARVKPVHDDVLLESRQTRKGDWSERPIRARDPGGMTADTCGGDFLPAAHA